MEALSPEILALLVAVAALAGLVDAIAGGGAPDLIVGHGVLGRLLARIAGEYESSGEIFGLPRRTWTAWPLSPPPVR